MDKGEGMECVCKYYDAEMSATVAFGDSMNDFLTGKHSGSFAREELYNSDPKSGDARLCGTTASLCGIEGEVLLYGGRYIVDAKSIMGIFSLDLSKPLRLEIKEWKEEYMPLLEKYVIV